MSSSYKGFWLNGSKETGYTSTAHDSDVKIARQPTLAAAKRAIVAYKQQVK